MPTACRFRRPQHWIVDPWLVGGTLVWLVLSSGAWQAWSQSPVKDDRHWKGASRANGPTDAAEPAKSPPPENPDMARVTPPPTQGPPAAWGKSAAQQGQIWKDYDIRPFSQSLGADRETDRYVLDWILRETGHDTWFRPPLGALNVTKETVRVFHTPEVQAQVSDVVRRLVRSSARRNTFSARILLVANGNWRAKALPVLHPIRAQTAGVEAWTMAKEEAALFLAEMRKRPDVRELTPTHTEIKNGETHSFAQRRPRNYPQTVTLDQKSWPGYQLNYGQIDEGYSLDVSPLLGLDGRNADVVLRGSVQQIERMSDTWLDVPQSATSRVQIQVPQLATWQIHERFQWPTQQVLLVSRGIVATPDAGGRGGTLPIPNPLSPLANRAPRADALLIVECLGAEEPARGTAGDPPREPRRSTDTARQTSPKVNTRGRY